MQKTILVVDDSQVIREVIGFTLEINQFSVLYASGSQQALEQLNGQRIDLIITDLHMPNMNGNELIKEIRQKKEYQNIPILVLSTDGGILQKNEGRIAGATGWIIKPIVPEKLLNAISKVLR